MGWFDDCGVNGDAYSTQDTGEYTTKTTANGTVSIPKRIKKFLSGFNGYGWSIFKQSNGKYKLEGDDLLIRGSFTVFELIVSQIRAIRGSQAITQGCSKIKSVSTYNSGGVGYYRLTIEEDTNSIMEHDFIRCQKGGKIYHVEVASVGATYIDVKMSEFTSGLDGVVTNPPEPSDEIVQFGNSSHDAKYAKRHSAIYMHVDDGEPAIDFMENIYSKDWSNTTTIRLGGNLPGTNGKRGLYCVNGKLVSVDANNNKIYEINPDGSGMFGFGAFRFSKDGIEFSKDAQIKWNNFIDEYITNGTTIGSQFVASPTGFFGVKSSAGKLTGVLMGKDVTVNGATRTGIFALVDDVPVFELDPITKKYKFKGEVNATSGSLDGLTVNRCKIEDVLIQGAARVNSLDSTYFDIKSNFVTFNTAKSVRAMLRVPNALTASGLDLTLNAPVEFKLMNISQYVITLAFGGNSSGTSNCSAYQATTVSTTTAQNSSTINFNALSIPKGWCARLIFIPSQKAAGEYYGSWYLLDSNRYQRYYHPGETASFKYEMIPIGIADTITK